MTTIAVPISPGELLDKISILRIKKARITDPVKAANVRHELDLLETTWRNLGFKSPRLEAEERALEAVNTRLWDVEDALREHEARQAFGPSFIELARSVYVNNDERAAIKKRINLELGSKIVEEKSYTEYKKT